jgi:hypothetical protein
MAGPDLVLPIEDEKPVPPRLIPPFIAVLPLEDAAVDGDRDIPRVFPGFWPNPALFLTSFPSVS